MPSYRVFLGAPTVADVLEELDDPGAAVPSGQWVIAEVDVPDEPLPPRTTIQESQLTSQLSKTRLTIDPAARARLDRRSLFQQTQHPKQSRISALPKASPEDESLDLLPEETFHQASQRLSKLYAGVIFAEEGNEEEDVERVINNSGGEPPKFKF